MVAEHIIPSFPHQMGKVKTREEHFPSSLGGTEGQKTASCLIAVLSQFPREFWLKVAGQEVMMLSGD